ncbi:LysR family transcriptional regulator [Pseudobythopirellula maris]|nr:LysR family transcriptional regulator [Pseudobythopirellula maris]
MHQLRYFVAVAEERNFTRAAETCSVAQPSLSQQIIKLEKELGHKLFDRLGRQVRLTDAGRLLYGRATSVLEGLESTREELAELAGAGRGRVSVGAMLTAAPYLLPPVLKAFGRSHPEAEVIVHEGMTDRVLEECKSGALDLALLAMPVDDDQLHVEPLFEDELLLAVHPKHRLATKKRVTLEDVMAEPFILLDPIHCLGKQVLSYCLGKECKPRVACRSSQILTVQELVALDYGVSLLPASAAAADKSKSRCYVSLCGASPSRSIALVWRRNRVQSGVVKAFADEIRRRWTS